MSDRINTIGERIKFLRQITNKKKQKKLADATGISRGNLSNYEKDGVQFSVPNHGSKEMGKGIENKLRKEMKL